jgi:glutathione S-transferase
MVSHIAFEESGLPYEAVEVHPHDKADPRNKEFFKLNPKGTVPTLSIGDVVVTESQAILTYVGDAALHKHLIPPSGTLDRIRAHEMMNVLSSSLHVGFRQVLRPQAFADSEAAALAIREKGFESLNKTLKWIDGKLENRNYAVGNDFTVVDAYLFLFYLWASHPRTGGKALPGPNYRSLANRVWERPAVKKIVAREGFEAEGLFN